MIKYITNHIHSFTSSNAPTSLLSRQPWTGKQTSSQQVPPENVKHWKWCTWHQKAFAKNSSKWKALAQWSESNKSAILWWTKQHLFLQIIKIYKTKAIVFTYLIKFLGEVFDPSVQNFFHDSNPAFCSPVLYWFSRILILYCNTRPPHWSSG